MKAVKTLLLIILYCIHSAVGAGWGWGRKDDGSRQPAVEGESLRGGSHVCPYSGYKKERKVRSCGPLWMNTCSSYRSVATTLYRCCSGWASGDGRDCNIPLCAGLTNPKACDRYEGYIIRRDGSIVRNSGGVCVDANTCAYCNEGYYSENGYCWACTRIDNCNFPKCEHAGGSICEYCEGEYSPEYGSYGYTRFVDGGKTCKQACSWRKGSRCYPGNCADTTTASCKCHEGFSGPDCDQIIKETSILVNHLNLTAGLDIVEAPPIITSSDVQPTTWTNQKLNNLRAHATLKGNFKIDLPSYPYLPKSRDTSHLYAEVGITYGKIQLDLYRGGNRRTVKKECGNGNYKPVPENFACEGDLFVNDWEPFKHQDRIQFTVEATNGGYVVFKNFDNSYKMEKYNMTGKTKQSSFSVVFDFQDPIHCRELASSCSSEPIIVPDVTNTSLFKVTWNGWQDNDSGISTYEIEVFQLIPDGKVSDVTKLKHGDKVLGTPGPFNSSISETHISVKTAGAYAIVLRAIDKAGNRKSSRRILIFDNVSIVEKMNDPSKVTSASKETNYEWITTPCETVHIEWFNRFANKEHERSIWLNSVKKVDEVDIVLDDNEGERQINRKDNIHGIVRFEVGYERIYADTITHIPFKSIQYIHAESADLKEDMVDGKRLVIHVRAFDIMGKFSEDTVNVTIDTSPPVIENLWLTRGDRVNISVSSLREFSNLTIEWLAYDFHSGIDYVRWRLYDNYTGNTIVHGLDHLSPQGEAEDMKKCQAKYINYSRGHDCYCTPFNGCFHRHFVLKPHVSKNENQGLRPEKETGVHDGDYFFEVMVENIGKLRTTMTMKVTIDTSPPHNGSVHEGYPDQPELDFQQSTVIHAYWDGFFDKESGILFYRYGFFHKCLSADYFVLDYKNDSLMMETYSSNTVFNAPMEGTYFLTVAAYNHALEPSKPVCSDGISIDTSIPEVSEFRLEHVRIRGGLVKDGNDTVWYLDENRNLYKVTNPSVSCRSKATRKSTEELSFYPKVRINERDLKEISAKIVCDKSDGAPDHIIGVFSAPMHFRMSWTVSGAKSGIFDYYVGISSTESTLPDRFEFISTNQHAHVHIPFPNIHEGEQFYILVKAVSKSAMESVRALGPFLVDSTRPKFSGEIDVTVVDGHLMATWIDGAFEDDEDTVPLRYQIAIGHAIYGIDVLPFTDVWSGYPCQPTNRTITCASVPIDKLQWQLHSHHTYYVTIKGENTGGLFVKAQAKPYIHDIQVPSKGVVFEIEPTSNNELQDIEDVDFQKSTSSISAKWYGFLHPDLEVTYTLCVRNKTDIFHCEYVGNATSYTLTSVRLEYFKTYFIVITAITTAGNTSVTSDGVTVVREGEELAGIRVMDGHSCRNTTKENVTLHHHSEDKRIFCVDDIDYQTSMNIIEAHWFVPEEARLYTPSVYWSIEERSPLAEIWSNFRKYEHIHMSNEVRQQDIDLQPGRTYRIALKFCAEQICFHPVYSNGVTVTPSPPVTGTLSVQYSEEDRKIYTILEKLYDPDIAGKEEAVKVMDHYEWAFTENSLDGSTITVWERINSILPKNLTHVSFNIDVPKNVSFTKCWQLAIRGYTHTGLSSVVSSDIRSCTDRGTVRENVVLDVTGDQVINKGGSIESLHGREIFLEENEDWRGGDVDYTPYQNILSAVWPKLRYPMYSWAVLEDKTADPTTFYKPDMLLKLKEPCSHPDALQCGTTENEYINVKFNDTKLEHGKRYVICIHTNRTVIKHEKWEEDIPETSACSDGITVDLTPPKPGRVWLGVHIGTRYQGSKSDITVNWESFEDVEELGHSVHASGIKEYYLALGTSPGAIDVMPFKNVGIKNHMTIHGLNLQNGHTYFAAVKALDFANRTSVSMSAGITVDNTAPVTTVNVISIDDRHLNDINTVSACWRGVFEDKESGIEMYQWAVGSQPGYCDIMPYTMVYEECSETSSTSIINLHEGHAYFVSVKGYNGLGLSTTAISWAFTVDASPPLPGNVYDGKSVNGKTLKDVDFTTDKSGLSVRWTGFNDPHTPIQEYYISIGTCKSCEDILNYQPVGIVYEMYVQYLRLIEGIPYYTTVTACNTAGLCTSVTSDGILIDTSPPSRGKVQDGTDSEDIHYQASINSIGAKWFGFSDPQSGISHFTWRAGTYPGGDNILNETMLHQNELAVVPDLFENTGQILPLGQRIYITVKACNRAGRCTESTSNGFMVDISPPQIMSSPQLVDLGIVYPDTTISRTMLRVKWDTHDNESYIERQYLSIKSHIGGDFNMSSIQIGGIVRDYTFVGLDLHDGSQYCVTVVVCNGAKLCTSAMTPLFVVDSSPPTPGMFAINTDHAANLQRQPEDWMKWSIYNVDLAWLGFSDIHSGITFYKINIGSTYMGSDLNKNPSEPVTVVHNTSGEDKGNEGVVQTYQIPTVSLNRHELIYISMWAVNGAGLRSPMLHSLFRLHYGGLMELVRRCSAHTCLGHCVCAPQEGKCDLNGAQCINISNAADHKLDVIDIQNLEDPTIAPQIRYSAMDSVLAARWTDDDHAAWYEWSVGESLYDEPTGVFSARQENVWHHVGEERYMIYSLPRGKNLHNGFKYSFFIRAWYNESSYRVFKSPGVYIDSKPPRTTNIKGISVKETVGNLTKDVDFAKLGDELYVDWTSKFLDAKPGGINIFRLYISTYPGGHDVYAAEDVIDPTVSRYFLPLQNLIPSTRYYANVQAYGKSGLHTTVTSDGFMIDVDPPEPGMVYDGQGWRDMEFQNSSADVRASWHSFSDLDSGISHYMWCSTTASQSTLCSIMSWNDMGLFTNGSHRLNTSVVDGTRIVHKIYAIDAVGHTSPIVVSDGVTVDSTAAVSEDRSVFLNNIVHNPSFEADNFGKTCMEIEHMTNCETRPITGWTSTPGSCVWLATTNIHHAQDGNSFLVAKGSVAQAIQGLEKGQKYRVVFYTSHLPFSLTVISNKEGFISIDGSRHVFFLHNKVHRQDNRHAFQTIMIWHQHTFFFQARSTNITLEIGSTDRSTGIAIDNIQVQRNVLRTDPSMDTNYHVQAHTVYVHDWTSVHASWNFVDPDSPIVDYSWAIGYIVGGSQLQDFRSVGLRTFAFNSSLKLKHNSRVHVTVVATNAVGLKTVSYSEPIIVDLTPPVLEVINDGKGPDIDFQDTSIIIANWDVNDPESGIKECKWSIGTAPGENDLQNFTKAEQGTWTFTQQFQMSDVGDKTIYVNVRCENGADLVSSRSSDGVHVFRSAPSADSLEINVMGTSNSVYIPHNYFHADVSDVRIRWSGFKDDIGIEMCEVTLEGPGTAIRELETVDTRGYMCTDFKGLHLKDGLHRISITGINSVKMRTETKVGNFTVLTKPPIKHDGRTIVLSWNPSGGTVTASWDSLFSSEYPLQYEVSAGTVQGGSDIIQWQETRENQLKFSFDKEAIGPTGKDVFVSVRAISPSGLYETANSQILLTS
ncbi:hypothetical protein ACJMK2_021192 [Sinanodonta woodiana]|uniref:Fibronectin type-III domain-containing protein n=1 Tax=Sinanodonta woodiana TaxID=1069815 RepID=A0ABD3U489_SINWO